jgi:hypothetical protein
VSGQPGEKERKAEKVERKGRRRKGREEGGRRRERRRRPRVKREDGWCSPVMISHHAISTHTPFSR